MRNRRDYELVIELIREVIHDWDPYSLLQDGSPDGEFDAEIARLATFVPGIHSVDDAAQAVSVVFSDAYGDSDFSKAQCLNPAQRLFDKLLASGLTQD